jgi:hypothetical protein
VTRASRWCADFPGVPASYRQVWLVSAPLMASGFLTGGLVAALWNGGFAADRFLLSVAMAAVSFVGRGAIESYELGKRIDAMAYTEWLEARDRPGVG